VGQTANPLVEGNLCIDLVNTEEIRRGVRKDFIGSPDEFAVWLTEEEMAGALSKIQLPFEVEVWSPENVEHVHELRYEVRSNLEQLAEGESIQADFVRDLESFIEQAPFTMKLKEGKVVKIPIGRPFQRLCSLVAADILRLIEEDQFQHLRLCTNPHCLFLFLDTSGRRKWCSMKRCGNRAKVVKHLKRQVSGDLF
jgi:predicted RNA-binding Zn ribbon-like protein